MRQLEGKETEKRLSATRVAQAWLARVRPPAGEGSCETIERPATATLAWLARIRSSILLKTASSSRGQNHRGQTLLQLLQYSGDCRR
jgi:hypothetical protein